MRIAKRILFISVLLMLLAGALLMDPMIRFIVDLHFQRFERAAAVYSSQLLVSDELDKEAKEQLQGYVERWQDKYFARELTYDQVMAVLSPLSRTVLPQEYISRCVHGVNEMEKARTDLAQADIHAVNGNFAAAIPLYRQSLVADDGAAFRLQKAEADYESQLLQEAETAMDEGKYLIAENVLLDGLTVLESNDDLTRALEDVRRMEADALYGAQLTEARRLLQMDGPEASFQYVRTLRQQAPDQYELAYMEQLLYHEYEAERCFSALAMQTEGDPSGACALLEEALLHLDSERIKALRQEIRTSIVYWLGDMPVLEDETGSMRTGSRSTVALDQVLMDSGSNEYTHSISADQGSLCFSLEGTFDTFTGTVAFPLGETADIYRASATLQVYGDDRLIAEFKEMDSSSLPIPFSIPVEGVRVLKLRWTSEGANGWKDWGRFATVFDGRLVPPGGN